MAKIIKETVDWDKYTTRARFPWDKWTDGQVWSCEHGKDFQSAPAVFTSQLRKKAETLKTTVRTAVKKDEKGSTVVFQFGA